jgi:2,4-diaminopentanoate dehydrogenase
VIQWATGVVGSAAPKGVLRHPRLELAGVKVYAEAKQGRDAGDLIGGPETGVIAARDVDALLRLGSDCVLYCPLPWSADEICRLLEAGLHGEGTTR